MVKYTVMRFLIIVIAFLTSSAYAAKNVLPRPVDDYYGREVSILFDAPISPSAFNSSWNLVRVAKRGLSFADESVTYSLFNDPFFIIVR